MDNAAEGAKVQYASNVTYEALEESVLIPYGVDVTNDTTLVAFGAEQVDSFIDDIKRTEFASELFNTIKGVQQTSSMSDLKGIPKKGIPENTGIKYKLLTDFALDRNINPIDLIALMHFETRGTMSTSVQNRDTKATGLIQFMPFTARGLGTTIHALKRMSTDQQLKHVHKYFRNAGLLKKKHITPEDLYCTVTAPSMLNASSETIVYRKPQAAYNQNTGWDTNKDGVIRKKEFGFVVKSRRKTAIKMLRYVFEDSTVNKWIAELS